jgi:hypothetical protein
MGSLDCDFYQTTSNAGKKELKGLPNVLHQVLARDETHTCIAVCLLRIIKPYAALRVPARWLGLLARGDPSIIRRGYAMVESLDTFTTDRKLEPKDP